MYRVPKIGRLGTNELIEKTHDCDLTVPFFTTN